MSAAATAAVNKLRDQMRGCEVVLTQTAWADLTKHLETRLLRVLHPTLSSSVVIKMSDGEWVKNKSRPERNSVRIKMSDLPLREIFRLLPDAKETIGLVIRDWVRTQQTMLCRLERDWNSLTPLIPNEKRLRVIHITPGMSDPHGKGQTVTMLQFGRKSRLVYKPRLADGERLWFSTLRWLDKCGFGADFDIPKLLSRRRYFWMSFVKHRCCSSRKSVVRYYFRWGAQAAVAQVLGCADLHRQNWIASGEHPVLVDAEMVGQTLVNLGQTPRNPHARRLHPLLRTGLLPLLPSDDVGLYRHIAPFEGTSINNEHKTFWPVYAGHVYTPDSYASEIIRGFLATSRFLQSSQRRDLFRKFVLRAAQRTHLRVLKRATARYYQLLDDSLQPQHMQAYGQRLEYLLSRCGRDEIGSSEAHSLLRCSVPRFTANAKACRTRREVVPSTRVMLDSAKILASRLASSSRSNRSRNQI